MTSLTRKIAEGAFVSLMNTSVLVFVSLLSSIILIRVLGVFDYGLLTLAFSATGLISSFFAFGIASVVIADIAREIGRERTDRVKSLLIRYMQVEVLRGFILFIVIFFFSDFVAARYNETIGGLVRISAFFLFFESMKRVLHVTFKSHLKFRYLLFLDAVQSLTKLALVIILVVILDKGVTGAMATYPLSTFISIVVSLPLFIGTIKPYKKIERSREGLFYNMIKGHGKWAIATVYFQKIQPNVTPWVIEFFLGVNNVAYFAVALKTSTFVSSLVGIIREPISPITSMEIFNWERTQKMLNRSIKYTFWVSIPLAAILLVMAPFLLVAAFTEKYLSSVQVFRILLLMLPVVAFRLIFEPLFYALKAQKYLFFVNVIGVFPVLILEIILIYLFGLPGVAIAIVVSEIILVRFRYYLIRKVREDFELKPEIFRIDEYDKRVLSGIIKEVKSRI